MTVPVPTTAAAALSDAPPGTTIEIEAVSCPSTQGCEIRRLRLPAGSVLLNAVEAAGWTVGTRAVESGDMEPAESFGIWGKVRALDHVLRDRDRVERYRALTVDPKEARRLRHARHRERFGSAKPR